MRHGLTLLCTLALAGTLGSQALGDTFAPVGLWRGEASGDVLLVWGEGFCSMGGSVTIGGPCTWTPEERAGTLSMQTDRALSSQSHAVTVSWVDHDTILVNGDERFRRQG